MGIASGVISATESESEESERLFRLRLELRRLRSSETQIDGVGSRSGRMMPITMHVLTLCDWFISSASALVTPTEPSFHLIVNDGVVSGIRCF